MIDGVSFLWLYVADLERSIRFYGQTLGLALSGRWDEGAAFDLGNLVLGVHIEEGKVTRGNSPVITFRVPSDIDQIYGELKSRGVRFIRDVTTEPYGKIASFEDPDGHALLLHQPRDSSENR